MMLHCAIHNYTVCASSVYMLQGTLQKLFMYSGLSLGGWVKKKRGESQQLEKWSLAVT